MALELHNAGQLPTFGPSQSAWAMDTPIGKLSVYIHYHLPSIIIIQTKS